MSTVASSEIQLQTLEAPPSARVLGAVRYWGSDGDLRRAEEQAIAGLREQAGGLGADVIAGLRVEIVAEQRLRSRSPLFTRLSLVEGDTIWLVYAYGTAVGA